MSYNFEEQEQIARMRHFWERWGTQISAGLLAVAVGFAGYYGWQWWQRNEGAKAAVVFEQVQAAIQSNNPDKIEQAWAVMQSKAPGSAYAGMAALAVAKSLHDAGKNDQAIAALNWAIEHASGPSVRAVARLNLSALQIDARQYAQANKTLADVPEPTFTALFDVRRGDLALLQGQRDAARTAYEAALKALPADSSERAAIEQKLQSVGGGAA
ncbi:MAG: tetratricopeptide repeat protein [Thiomonas sp.]|uniref:YfgM family protein n=1 Tax=Thiomonas sp. TaxID=2047785 RepID=UPI002A35FEEF|nr:tetratricopeptide repeat protein [Thiomonas sp.]MDY0329026.1 tetratricopeptide repeat protein [Thiomonas sp.]